MKNKMMLAVMAGMLLVPAYAQEIAAPAQKDECPFAAAKQGEFKKAQKEHRAKMKATEEKMEKLVKEYGKLKGKKQEAKKAEIATEVEKIHEEQLKFKEEQLDKFAKRLEEMKARLEEEKSADGKKAWVEKKTNELIEAKGDVKVLFERPGHDGKFGPGMNGPKMDGKKGHFGPKFGKDMKGMKGPKGGPRPEGFGPQGEHEGDFPPPPPDAE